MSIQFQASNDSFVRATVTGVAAAQFPMTFGLWIKYDAVINAKTVAAAGYNDTLGNHIIVRDWSAQQVYRALSGGAGVDTETAEGVLTENEWWYVAATRVAANSGTLYIGKQGSPSIVINNIIDAMGAWNAISDWAVSAGGPNVDLSPGVSVTPDFKAAEMALWERVLSTVELDEIKEGASPGGYTSGLLGHWLIDSIVEADALADQTANGNDLVVYKADATPGAGTVPPLFVADHPTVVSGTSVSATLVQDNIDTPYANKTGLHYTISSGANVGALTIIMSGTDGATDASGVINLSPPGVTAGDKLILNVFDPSAADIHAADTVVLIGSVQVQ